MSSLDVHSDDRKQDERHLHDHLRGVHADDPHYNTNKKWYAIDAANLQYERDWLESRIAGRSVLDYCCGNGKRSIWLSQNGARVTGIDISSVSIENARAAAKAVDLTIEQVDFRVMDAEAMQFPDNTFDYIVINGVLHHLDLPRAFAELARVLKPGGAVIATEALKHNKLIAAYRKRTPHLRSAWETEHILGREEISLARQYFDDVRTERFFHLATIGAVPWRSSRWFEPILRVLRAVDRVLLTVPGLRWQAWMVVFTMSKPHHLNNSSTDDLEPAQT